MGILTIDLFFIIFWIVVVFAGFIADKSNFVKKDNSLILLRDFSVDNLHWIILFILIFSFVAGGNIYFLREIIGNTKRFVEESLVLSIILTSFIFAYGYKKIKGISLLENIVKLSAMNDENYFEKLKKSNLNKYSVDRNIPLGLILEKQGIRTGSIDHSGLVTMHNSFLQSFGDYSPLYPFWDHPPEYDIAKKIANPSEFDKFWRTLYQDLKKLDSCVKRNLPQKIKKKSRQDIYYLRLNFLEMAIPYLVNEKHLVLGKPDKGKEILYDFFKKVLNQFYDSKDYWKSRMDEYTPQHESYSDDKFEEYFSAMSEQALWT